MLCASANYHRLLDTHNRHEQLSDLLDRSVELQSGPVLRVLDRDEYMQVVV
jgi:hypothetical protein